MRQKKRFLLISVDFVFADAMMTAKTETTRSLFFFKNVIEFVDGLQIILMASN